MTYDEKVQILIDGGYESDHARRVTAANMGPDTPPQKHCAHCGQQMTSGTEKLRLFEAGSLRDALCDDCIANLNQ